MGTQECCTTCVEWYSSIDSTIKCSVSGNSYRQNGIYRHTCQPRLRKPRDWSMYFSGTQYISNSLVFQDPDNSTFSILLTGHGTQYTSQKAGCPAKNETVGKYANTVQTL